MAKNSDTDESTESETSETKSRKKRDIGGMLGSGVAQTRTTVARVVWGICVLFAVILALGALCVALDANQDNGLVEFLLDTAGKIDLGVFSREDGIKTFDKPNADVKNALFNWGIAAVVWLVIGRVADRVIRP